MRDLRAQAQAWLRDAGYVPSAVDAGSHWLMFAAGFVPWLRTDDHPNEDLHAMRFRTSLPASIEAFVRERVPGAERPLFDELLESHGDQPASVMSHGQIVFSDSSQPIQARNPKSTTVTPTPMPKSRQLIQLLNRSFRRSLFQRSTGGACDE